MTQRDRIAKDALALAPDDRAYVADLLEQSLSTQAVSSEVAAAWTAEMDRRLEAYDRGETHAIDAESAIENARKALVERRAKRVTS